MDFLKMVNKAADELKEVAENVIDSADGLLGQMQTREPVGQKPDPVHKKVLSIVYDPKVPSEGGKRLSKVLKWNDPAELSAQYIEDLRVCSYGYANYAVVDTIMVDGLPVKKDGFAYTPDGFLKCWREKKGFHDPDAVDYHRILRDHKIIPRINSGEIDEVWLWGFPYAGYYESIMAGPGAFWCNAPALKDTDEAKRRFIIMGYNYQRGVGEMLENMGHRSESILKRVFRKKDGDDNLWQRFAQYDKTHPNQAQVGVMHFAPNSERDYDWGNKRSVVSYADDWFNFPDFKGEKRTMDCKEWGDGNTRLHHLWWYRRLPHITGSRSGISYNWWEYIVDPNLVR